MVFLTINRIAITTAVTDLYGDEGDPPRLSRQSRRRPGSRTLAVNPRPRLASIEKMNVNIHPTTSGIRIMASMLIAVIMASPPLTNMIVMIRV